MEWKNGIETRNKKAEWKSGVAEERKRNAIKLQNSIKRMKEKRFSEEEICEILDLTIDELKKLV